MRRLRSCKPLLLVCLLLAGCPGAVRWDAPPSPPPAGKQPPRAPAAAPRGVHVVEPGETVFSIAFRHGLSQQQLVAWNRLGNGELIFPGQRLRLTAPPRAAAPQIAQPMPAIDWEWPARGRVNSGFGGAGVAGKGIDIAGKHGDPVFAAAAGKVVYSGSGLRGYGKLIIIKHNTALLSAYGYNNTLLVNEGDQVRAGQRIAGMGAGPGQDPALHFEIRVAGKPVNPLGYLPSD